MSSEVITKPTSPTGEKEEGVHDSEEYESAEEIEEEQEEYDEEEVEEIEVEVEEDEEDDQAKDGEDGKDKPLDDDEDRKNPQFIPKKGYFYEHDDRMTGEQEPEDTETPLTEEREPQRKSSVGSVKTKGSKVISDRWSHDLYDEKEQTPKSPGELEERYGYDIRVDDMAPRARRKRVYGRGPTKYTRNWEEEEAYHRPRGGFRGRRGSAQRGRDTRQGQPARRGSRGYDDDFPHLAEDPKKDLVPDENNGSVKNSEVIITDRYRGGNVGRGSGFSRPARGGDNVNEDRDRTYGSRGGGGRGRGNGSGGGRRNEFTNRNRYADQQRRDSGGGLPFEVNTTNNRKTQEIDSKPQPKPSSGRGNNLPSELPPKPSTISQQAQPPSKKSTLPFTNTEYTGSASLTANRNLEQKSEDRDNISVKLINSGPDQGNREVRIDKDRPNQGKPGRTQPQQQSVEATKPKRFSTQRTKSDTPLTSTVVSASPPPIGGGVVGGQVSIPQPMPMPQGQGGPIPLPNPTQVQPPMYPTPYYEQVPIPTNYDGPGYESSGSPISVPHTHAQSVSPSLWTAQLPGPYSTSPYPSPPTGPPPPTGYDPSYIAAPQPQIFAPPPHPHPQFISDPTIINYPAPPPQSYGTPFHPQGFQVQGYQNPGPELYHAGVTYYSPQTQMQRPHMMVPTKRPKSVLQLVEPKRGPPGGGGPGPRHGHPHLGPQEEALMMSDMYLHHQYREESLPHVVDYKNTSCSNVPDYTNSSTGLTKSTADLLAEKLEETVRLQGKSETLKKSPSPAPLDLKESPSWAEQMADLTPISSPSEQSSRKNSDFQGASFEKEKTISKTE